MHSSKSVDLTSENSPGSLRGLLLACRPKTLSAAIVPVVVAVAIALYRGFRVSALLTFSILCSALFIQIGTNLFNDAIDFEKGADSHTRLGPQRATQMGWVPSRQVKTAAAICFLFAALFAVPLLLRGGWPILAIGVTSLALGYLYTGGPYPLAYTGTGDLFVIVFFGIVAVMGSDYLLTGNWLVESFIGGLQVGALSTVLIGINNFRDMETDRAIGKMTLPARYGASFARVEVLLMFTVAFGLLFYWPVTLASLLFLPSLGLAVTVIVRVWRTSPSAQMNRLLHLAALAEMTFGLALALLLISSGRMRG